MLANKFWKASMKIRHLMNGYNRCFHYGSTLHIMYTYVIGGPPLGAMGPLTGLGLGVTTGVGLGVGYDVCVMIQ